MSGGSKTEFNFDDRQRKALRYCTYCPKLCRFACPVAHGEVNEASTPWGLMRLLNALDQGQLELDDQAFEHLYHCMSCGRCQSFCLHDNPVAEVLAKGRAELLRQGKIVPEAYRTAPGGCGVSGTVPAHAPTSDEVTTFRPACAHAASGSAEQRLLNLLEQLDRMGFGLAVEGSEAFQGCGYFEWEAGALGASARTWMDFTQAHHGRSVVTDCSTAPWPAVRPTGAPAPRAIHLVSWFHRRLKRLPALSSSIKVGVHDSCFATRRLDLADELRDIVTAITAAPALELFENREQARCCGAEGRWGQVEPAGRERATRTVVDDILDSNVDWVVTASPKCRASLQEGLDAARAMGPGGAPVVAMDVLELVAAAGREQ